MATLLHRWDAQYETVRLSDIEHKCLTKPRKVFEYSFCEQSKARGKEAMLKLDVIEKGHLNAIVFWFVLHLDDEISISTGV